MRICFFISLILCLVFIFYPELDLIVAKLPHNPHKGFPPKKEGILGIIYYGTYALVISSFVIFSSLYIYQLYTGNEFNSINRRFIIFFLLSIILAPGLVVNVIIKNHSGRARPGHIAEFGGPKHFTQPLMITNQCEKNCSFVSGHAASGFALMAFAFVFKRRKYIFMTLGITVGLVIGTVRIIQGGHFLSDILFAGVITYMVIALLHYVMYTKYKHILPKVESTLFPKLVP